MCGGGKKTRKQGNKRRLKIEENGLVQTEHGKLHELYVDAYIKFAEQFPQMARTLCTHGARSLTGKCGRNTTWSTVGTYETTEAILVVGDKSRNTIGSAEDPRTTLGRLKRQAQGDAKILEMPSNAKSQDPR